MFKMLAERLMTFLNSVTNPTLYDLSKSLQIGCQMSQKLCWKYCLLGFTALPTVHVIVNACTRNFYCVLLSGKMPIALSDFFIMISTKSINERLHGTNESLHGTNGSLHGTNESLHGKLNNYLDGP